jgi:hypothetical protein
VLLGTAIVSDGARNLSLLQVVLVYGVEGFVDRLAVRPNNTARQANADVTLELRV